MNKIVQYGLQAFYYILFMTVVWYFSIKPAYHQLSGDQGVITLSFTHATKIREACRKLSQEELSKLAPNMRLAMDCPRERSPLRLELYLDNQLLTETTLQPPGFRKDQNVNIFHRIKVKAGEHMMRVWMNDDVNVKGPTHEYAQKIMLHPEQQLLIDFDAAADGFFAK